MSIVHYFHAVVSNSRATVVVTHPSLVPTTVATMGSGASVFQGGRSRLITNVIFVHTTERTDADIERVANEWDRN